MVQQREEVGLSLSLSFSGSSDHEHKLTNTTNNINRRANVSSPLDLNLMPCSSSTSNLRPENNTWTPHSPGPKMETCRVDKRRLIREIASCEDVKECSTSDGEDRDDSRKKLRLSKEQAAILEESFKEHNTLNLKQKTALAKRLGLRPRQVEVWFQNRRARTKLKQTEVDCEFLKRCCQTLTEENRKLQKEVQELRALNLSHQFFMPVIPPTTLTICPSCEHFAVPTSATTSSVCPSTTRDEPPKVHAMSSTITIDSISSCGTPTRCTQP